MSNAGHHAVISGVGAALARRFADEGCRVIPRGRLLAPLEAVAESVPFARMTADDLNAALSVTLTGVFTLRQACLPRMQPQG